MAATQKTYFAKIYQPTVSGITTSGILSTVQDFAFTGFTWNINAGQGTTLLRFPRTFASVASSSDIAPFNQVDIYISDKESGQAGYKLFSGYILDYTPTLDGSQEYVDVTVAAYPYEFKKKVVVDASNNPTITYTNQDPTSILRDVFNRYDGKVALAANIANTNNSVSYTFKQNTVQEALDVILKLAPAYWFWRVGADNTLTFQARDTSTIDHTLVVGNHLSKIAVKISVEELTNNFYFLGGSSIWTNSSRTTSKDTYGHRDERLQDERVTDTTSASAISKTFLDFYDHPIVTIEATVVDSNGDLGGYDIELFQPGQIVKIIDPNQAPTTTLWDSAVWDFDVWDYSLTSVIGQPLQIRSVDYTLESARLTLALDTPDIAREINKLRTNIFSSRTSNTPVTAPTLV